MALRSREGFAVPTSSPRYTAVESHETRWLSSEPEVPGSVGWDAHLPRIATIVRLRHRDGTAAGVANTHFDHASDQARLGPSPGPDPLRPGPSLDHRDRDLLAGQLPRAGGSCLEGGEERGAQAVCLEFAQRRGGGAAR